MRCGPGGSTYPLALQVDPGRVGDEAYEPALAESWEWSDDRRSITFTLREGARWSDGEPIDASDVVFTWKAQTADGVPWQGIGSKRLVQEVAAVEGDPRRVIFHFGEPYATQFRDAVEGPILPEHAFSSIPFAEWKETNWATVAVSSGPFVLDEYSRGERLIFSRNPHYFVEGLPRVDRVVVQIVSEASLRTAQLRAGEADLLLRLAPAELEQFGDDIGIVSYLARDVEMIGWNFEHEAFSDPRVRRAMTLAIDRQVLVDNLLHGEGVVSPSLVSSYQAAFNANIKPLPYDIHEARRLLQQAGYATDDQPSGRKLSFTLLTNTGNPLRMDTAVTLQSMLAQVGVEMRIETIESRSFGGRLMAGEYDAFLRGLALSGAPDELRVIFGPEGNYNYMRFRDAEIGSTLDAIEGAADWATIKPGVDFVQERVHDEQAVTVLFEKRALAAHSGRLQGVRIDVPADSLARLEHFWLR